MSAFIPQFKNDVFISYARVDDEPLLPGDEESRWVRTLRRSLQTLLNQRAKGASIWMDIADIGGNQSLTGEIRDGILGSATLLIIMSDGYLQSEWYRQELESFLKAGGPSAGIGRVFVVHRDEIPLDQWPKPLREMIGFPFYNKDAGTGSVMPLAVPKPDPQEKEYFARLYRLRDQLVAQLRKMQGSPSEPAKAVGISPVNSSAPTTTTSTTSTSTTAAQSELAAVTPAEPDRVGATTVFLAEVTGDLYEYREQVQTWLTQSGFRVLPTRFYSRTPAEFQEEMDRDLSQSALFVQLLGPYPSPRTENLPQGYEGLQAVRAVASGKPVLQWRMPSLDPEAIRDEQHRAMVFADTVVATDLEEFKRIVGETARKSVVKIDRPAGTGECFILLNATGDDLAIADSIADRLANLDVAFDIVDDSTPLADLTASDEYDGVIVIYGSCPQQWVQQQVRECRRIVLDKKHRAPECAVLIGPPKDKDPLRCRPPRFHVIEDQDQSQLEAYIAAVRQRRSNQ